MRILVSAGPTQEPIDSVRFITNSSSGRMGFALAKAAVKRGHKVTLVLGPVSLKPKLKDVRVVNVRTADEMAEAVLNELGKGFDVFISAAAVADYTPEKTATGKVKSGKNLVLRLKPTKKITLLAKKSFPKVFVVAFKAEYDVSKEELVNKAYSKMSREKLDLVVANDVKKNRMGSTRTDAYILDRNRRVYYLTGGRKEAIAGKIVRFIDCRLAPELS
ncbi:MAG: hypothetical protein FJY77_02960 [Candidatus Altiarchaeales archaeon]|nr:hypothetical protein [Candidatus Altiarchaeales archaeon]